MREFTITDGGVAQVRRVASMEIGTIVEWVNEPCLVTGITSVGSRYNGLVSLENPSRVWDNSGGTLEATPIGKLTCCLSDFK